jgi:DnaJ-class molecular chaperone
MARDYYDILGLAKSASAEEVKNAYRKLAREHHPDMVADADKANAEKRFKEINEAYQVLSDPQKKQTYDQFGHAGLGGNPGTGGGQRAGGGWGPFSYSYSTSNAQDFGDFDPMDIFEEVFGFRGFGGRSQRQARGKNLFYEMQLSFADAVKGLEKEVKVESGKFTIRIPAGVHDGIEIKYTGKGMPGPNNAPSGDLFITFKIKTPTEFQVAGSDIGIALEIDFVQAILGDVVEVPVVDINSASGLNKEKLKIPEGTQYGAKFKLSGKGFPRLGSSGNGDIYVQVFVKFPKKLNKKQKQLLEEYRKI